MSTNYAKLERFVIIRGIALISNVKMGTNGTRSAHLAQTAGYKSDDITHGWMDARTVMEEVESVFTTRTGKG